MGVRWKGRTGWGGGYVNRQTRQSTERVWNGVTVTDGARERGGGGGAWTI